MANYKSINTDPVSVLSGWEVWNGAAWVAASALPSVGDTAYANGFIKEIDQNWTCDIHNGVFQGTTAGGRFELLSAGITFDGFRTSGHQFGVAVMFVSFGGGVSNVLGGGTALSFTPRTLDVQGQAGGVLNLERTGIASATNVQGTVVTGNGNGFVINVSICESGFGGNSTGLQNTGSNYIINHNGVTANQGNTSIPYVIAGSGNRLVNNGIVNGPPAAVTNGCGAYITGTQNEFVNRGVCNATAFGPAVIEVVGNFVPATPAPNATYATSWVTLSNGSTLLGTNNHPAVIGRIRVDDGADVSWLTKSPTTQDVYLYTASALTGYPPESKTEAGYVFGPSGEFTGTLVPVNVDVQQLASNLLTEMETSTLPIAVRMRNTATDAFVTAAVAAITPAP